MKPINRNELKFLTKKEINFELNFWWEYYDSYYYYDDEYYNTHYNYSIDKSKSSNLHLLPNRTYDPKGVMPSHFHYSAVDMDSIYPKEVLRERKLNDLFGLTNGTSRKQIPLLGDLIKKDVKKCQ